MIADDPVIAELERKYGPASSWHRFRPERDADRERRARIDEARARAARGESPHGDQLPF